MPGARVFAEDFGVTYLGVSRRRRSAAIMLRLYGSYRFTAGRIPASRIIRDA
jgi:hypothetical protein